MPHSPINIDRLSEDELRDLHWRITERLRVIHQLRAHGSMMRFSIGERVAFNADGRRITGVLTRYNKRTVTVIAEGGERWNVSPGLLERRHEPAPPDINRPVVVETRDAIAPASIAGRIGKAQEGKG